MNFKIPAESSNVNKWFTEFDNRSKDVDLFCLITNFMNKIIVTRKFFYD